MCRDREGRLKFKDEFKRFEKHILLFSMKLREEAYRILDSKFELQRYRLEDGCLVYKLKFTCDTCKKSCNGNVVEKEKGEIPTTTHAVVSWVEHQKNKKTECCVCRKDKTKCELCQQR